MPLGYLIREECSTNGRIGATKPATRFCHSELITGKALLHYFFALSFNTFSISVKSKFFAFNKSKK